MAYLTTTGSGQPLLILKESTTRNRGKEAQRNNIMAAKVIGEVLKTTLGPRGMDKMLIDSLGDITITNDGAAILNEIDVEHPAAKMMVEIAKTQDDMVGDGTTTTVILAGELLKKAEELLDQNIHPTILVSGYRKAAQKAIETINKNALTVNIDDRKTLLKVALTSISGKAVGGAHEHLAEIAKNAVKPGAKIRILDPSQMKAFLDQETSMLKEMSDKIKKSGADIVFCQKGVDDMVQHFLAKEGIMAARRVKESDMEKLARATGGRIVSDIDDLKAKDLGAAGMVEERKIGEDKMMFVEKCKDPHSVAILIRAGLERMVDEAERAMTDALSVVSDVIENNRVVAGGGAIEVEIAKELRNYATKVGGREQIAVEAFADAVEIIPKALAENAGLEAIDVIVDLRAAHDKPEGKYRGINVLTGKVENMKDKGVIEPAVLKEQAIKSAAEAAAMILRIDDVIASTRPKEGAGPHGPPGGPEPED